MKFSRFIPSIWRSRVCLATGVFIMCATGARADVQTIVSFLSASTIQVGGTVTIDFGVNFTPLPETIGAPEFVDNQTGASVSSCSADPNGCTEFQFNTTASTLTSVFAELVAGNTIGAPNFYDFSNAGNFQLTLSYPNAGVWEITTAGIEQEQASELECSTQWDAGAPVGSASCSTILSFPVTGVFDPSAAPDVFVTVDPAGTLVSEPPSLGLFALAFVLFGLRYQRVIGVIRSHFSDQQYAADAAAFRQ